MGAAHLSEAALDQHQMQVHQHLRQRAFARGQNDSEYAAGGHGGKDRADDAGSAQEGADHSHQFHVARAHQAQGVEGEQGGQAQPQA